MASHSLVQVERIDITVIVDNEVDPISPSNNPAVQYAGLLQGVPLTKLNPGNARGGAQAELRMDSICCGAHGLSLLITATKDGQKHTILFDTGPEGSTWTRNAARLRADLASVEHIHLSHWHRDHSGGLLDAVRSITTATAAAAAAAACSSTRQSHARDSLTVGVHPDRPDYRGMLTPTGSIVSLEADPTINEIEAVGATVQQQANTHSFLDDFFLSSGAIPRRTEYEKGIRGGVRYVAAKDAWVKDEMIMDERLIMCNLKGKGIVVFTGCSHAGIINVCRHAVELGGGLSPLYAIVGGFHLADNNPEKLARSLQDLTDLQPQVLMPGHCTGWKFKFLCEQSMPAVLAPSFSGTTFTLSA
ncbi:beta-lactamase-like protein [Coniella lustricola]|uniref:Beta-lactamase-like protein n=1 Tax=Coniella lustricola TaxID=2025994 RepID=A0A2T3AAD7_9PEZI|nr:beta-lactamase-like protein [Coniella lustricola]